MAKVDKLKAKPTGPGWMGRRVRLLCGEQFPHEGSEAKMSCQRVAVILGFLCVFVMRSYAIGSPES